MKKAVVYARQSFGVEENSVSLDVQIESCRAWAAKNNVNVVGIYQDANTSSELYPFCAEGIEAARVDKGFQIWKKEQRTKGRKEFKQGLGEAFDCIKTQHPDYIIVYTSNRLGRSATNSNLNNFMTAYLMEHNCSIVDAQSNSVTDFSDKLMLMFRQIKDALDYAGVAEKRKASMESVAKRINSFRVVSNAYGVITDKGIISFDASKAEVIKMVFNGVIEGQGLSQILATLNRQYKSLANGKQWYNTNVEHILSNLVYCGYARNKAGDISRAINIPEPIISFSTWQKANEIVSTRKAGSQKYNVAGEHKNWLPYSGYLKCDCGRRMMLAIDNGIVYHCNNAGEHTNRIRLNAINHGQDFNLTLQSLFAISCIKSRKALEASKANDNRIDALKAQQATLENALKAKMRLITSDADYEFFKADFDELKQQISTVKQELIIAEEQKSIDADALTSRLDADFAAIMEPRLLDANSYQRLLQETIKDIVVRADTITINLVDGNSFDLPRIQIDRRGKKVLPWSEIMASTSAVDNLDSIQHYSIIFHGGNESKTLVDNDLYTIEIVAE